MPFSDFTNPYKNPADVSSETELITQYYCVSVAWR